MTPMLERERWAKRRPLARRNLYTFEPGIEVREGETAQGGRLREQVAWRPSSAWGHRAITTAALNR